MARFRHCRPDLPPSGSTRTANRGVGAVRMTRRARKLPGTNRKTNEFWESARSTCQLKASCVPFLAAVNYTAASCPHAISSADRLAFRALAGGDCLTVRLPFPMLQGLYAHFLTARRIT